MIPERFFYEYPARCLELIAAMRPIARQKKLIGSFSLLITPALFSIPLERMKKHTRWGPHPLDEHAREKSLYEAISNARMVPFKSAAFWDGREPGPWRFSVLRRPINDSHSWLDRHGRHPMEDLAENQIESRVCGEVLDVIRNALAHGNIVYLDAEGYERPTNEMNYLAFLSRCRDDDPEGYLKGYYLLATTELLFLNFIESWARWLTNFPMDSRIAA